MNTPNKKSDAAISPSCCELLAGEYTLRVFHGGQQVFASKKDRLLPLLEYLESFSQRYEHVVIWDKIMGNAAALLAVIAGAKEVYSPMGSDLAVKTLEKHGITYRFIRLVPCIQKPGGEGMCPMEQLSQGKEPEEFHRLMLKLIHPEKKEK